jgi:hypothetical protein
VGGPVTYTNREIAELAFAALGKQPKVRREPVWLVKAALSLVRLFSKRYYTMAAGKMTGCEGLKSSEQQNRPRA